MQNTINQNLKLRYTANFCDIVQELVVKRRNLRVNQNTMAFKAGVSLKTIQNFENYKNMNYYLIFAYREILMEGLKITTNNNATD